MFPVLYAQAVGGIPQLVIYAIVVCGVVGIGLVVARQAGVTVPPWVVQIAWIVLAVVVGVFAIKLLLSAV